MTMLEQERITSESPPPPPRSSNYASVVLGVVLVVTGLLWFVDAVGLVDVRLLVILPAALAAIGLALIIGSRDGPHTGLVVVGLIITGAVILAAVAPSGPVEGAIGEQSFVVSSVDDLQPNYDVGIGDLYLDISDLRIERSLEISAEVGAGRLVLDLPPGVPVQVEGTVGIGELRMPDDTFSGLGLNHTFETGDFDGAAAGITIVADVGVGELEVTR